MKRIVFIAALVMLTPNSRAQEKIVITAPLATEYRVVRLLLVFEPPACRVAVTLAGSTAQQELNHAYDGPTACNMIKALNTANLSTISLQRRIMERLVTDGVLSGTISGTPEP